MPDRIMPSNVRQMPKRGNGDGPQPPDSPTDARGIRPADRILEAKSGLVVRQLMETRDARRIARRHGVSVRKIVCVLIDHAEELRRERAGQGVLGDRKAA